MIKGKPPQTTKSLSMYRSSMHVLLKKITSARLYACEKHSTTEAEASGATPSWECFCQLSQNKNREEQEVYSEKFIILKRSILLSSSNISIKEVLLIKVVMNAQLLMIL